MIDLIKIRKKNISENEAKNIILKSGLILRFDKEGNKCYENGKLKDFQGGMFVSIDKDKNLKIEGSLHKYRSFLTTGKATNYDTFTLVNAKETILKLIENKGFEPLNAYVGFYEIGINLNFEFDVIEILNETYSIGVGNMERKMYVHPKFKNERHRTTEHHENIKTFYKMYDKIFEMKQKRDIPQEGLNILRMESVHKKINLQLLDFFDTQNLEKICFVFFSKWDDLNFDFNVNAPKGTHTSKIDLVKELIRFGTIFTQSKYDKLYKDLVISQKVHRTTIEFIKRWNTDKYIYEIEKTPKNKIWAKTYNVEKQIHSKNIYAS